MMKSPTIILLTIIAGAVAAAPAISRGDTLGFGGKTEQNSEMPSSGMLATMPHGHYQCALPGDAGSVAYRVVKAENFRIFTASRYENDNGEGTYILRGKELTFTQGPKKGQRFERVGRNQLRKLGNNGRADELLCTRLSGSR